MSPSINSNNLNIAHIILFLIEVFLFVFFITALLYKLLTKQSNTIKTLLLATSLTIITIFRVTHILSFLLCLFLTIVAIGSLALFEKTKTKKNLQTSDHGGNINTHRSRQHKK